ncbi:Translocon-associated protein subunit alpha [Diplonema papillatum]|nr:Translocon-associated protein subunit alpha [Diplonema papillatum]|eukprot:gene16040-24562_t
MSLAKMLWTMMVFGIALTTIVRAQDEDEDEDEENVTPTGVTLKTIFPGLPQDTVFATAGQPTKALVTFSNAGDTTYQLEFLNAHLASAHQMDHIVQNLTGILINRTVNEGESASVLYKFTPWKELEPRDYNLVLQLYFMSEDDNERISLSAFNQTVPVHDGTSSFDIQGLFLVILVVAGIGFAYNNFRGKKVTTARRTAMTTTTSSPTAASAVATETGTSSGNVDYSYISAQHRQATRNRSKEGRSKSPNN